MADMTAAVVLMLKDKFSGEMKKLARMTKDFDRQLKGIGKGGTQTTLGKPFVDAKRKAELLRLELGKLKTAMSGVKSHAMKVFGRAGIAGMILGGAKAGVMAAGMPMVTTAANFEKYRMMLKSATTSTKEYAAAQAFISKFERESPFNLEEVTRAYVRLRQQGVDPMTGSLAAAGDAAASNGGELIDAVEAIMDARTKEFERLKAFGITTSSKGNTATFSYADRAGVEQKITAELGSQKALTEAIEKIWAEKFGGSMGLLSKGWGGIVSSLESMRQNFELMVMESGPFARFKGMLSSLLDQLVKWEADGTMRKFAETWAQNINDTFDKLVPLAQGAWVALKDVAGVIDRMATAAGGYQNLGYFALALWLAAPAIGLIAAASKAAMTVTAMAQLAGLPAAGLFGVAGGLLAIGGALALINSYEPDILDKLATFRPGTNQGVPFKTDPNQMMIGQNIAAAAGQLAREQLIATFQEWDPYLKEMNRRIEAGVVDFIRTGGKLMQGLWDGMKAKFAELLSWVSTLPGQLVDMFNATPVNPPNPANGFGYDFKKASPAVPSTPSGQAPGSRSLGPRGQDRGFQSGAASQIQPTRMTTITNNITVTGSDAKVLARQIADAIDRRSRSALHDGAYA